jgi:hypothetical protein
VGSYAALAEEVVKRAAVVHGAAFDGPRCFLDAAGKEVGNEAWASALSADAPLLTQNYDTGQAEAIAWALIGCTTRVFLLLRLLRWLLTCTRQAPLPVKGQSA